MEDGVYILQLYVLKLEWNFEVFKNLIVFVVGLW